jgi:hypothetical protein
MKMSQGNSLHRYLKQTKMSFFSFLKIGEQEGGTLPALGRLAPVGGRRWKKVVEE